MSPVDPPNPEPPEQERYEAFVRLLVGREGRLRAFLRTLLPTWEDVDDVLQESSLVAWRKFAQFEEGTNFLNWLFAIARFEALKHLRRQARSPLVFSDELLELLERAYQTGARFHEVAAQAGRSATGFYKVIQRLRTALLECVQRRLRTEGAA